MKPSARRLTRRPKNKQMLENTIRTANVDGEEIVLLPPVRDAEPREKLIQEALSLMKKGSAEDWHNLVPLLTKLHRAKQTPSYELLDKLLNTASICGQTSIALDCVQRSKETGATLTNPRIHTTLLKSIRKDVVDADWSQDALQKGMSRLRSFASVFERDAPDAVVQYETRPRLAYYATILEMLAMNAWKHQDKVDADDSVLTASKKLLGSVRGYKRNLDMKTWPNAPFNDADELVRMMPFWHGLYRAQQVLKDELRYTDLANSIISELETKLSGLVGKLEETSPEDGSYAAEAIKDWRTCREA